MLYTTWVIWREFGVVSMDAIMAPIGASELKDRHAYVIMMTLQKHSKINPSLAAEPARRIRQRCGNTIPPNPTYVRLM